MSFTPHRQCLVCKALHPKAALIRLALLKETGTLSWDKSLKGFGRGIYLCAALKCCQAFLQEKKFKKYSRVLEEADKTGIVAFLQEDNGNG